MIRRSVTSKDPSLVALGLYGPALGLRLDVLIADDVVDFLEQLDSGCAPKGDCVVAVDPRRSRRGWRQDHLRRNALGRGRSC